MKYKIVPRRVSLLIYDKDEINYVASCQININGNKGTIDTLNGKDFYKFFKEYGIRPFRDLGLTEIKAAVTEAHFNLLKRCVAPEATIRIEENFVYEGIPLVWVSILENK